jgi:hypothetical protein
MTVTLPPAIHFWTALVAGMLLAFGFQLVLTGLSGAAGITAIGIKTKPRHAETQPVKVSKPKAAEPWADTVIKVESGAAIWVLLTTGIALFFATGLAIALGRPSSLLAGAAMGLAIWAGFLLIMLVFESRITGSLLGSLMSTATALFGSTVATVRDMLDARLAHRHLVQTAEEITAAVRREIIEGVDTQGITEKLDEYVSRLQPPQSGGPPVRHATGQRLNQATEIGRKVDMTKVGDWLKGVSGDQQLMALIRRQNVQLDRDDIARIVSRHTVLAKEQVDEIIDKLLQAWNALIGTSRQARESVDDYGRRIQKLKQYFRDTGRAELNPERFAEEFKILLSDPAAGLAALGRHAREIDRDSIAEVLRQRKDLSDSEIDRLADQYATQYHRALARIEEADAAAQDAKDLVLQRLRQFLDTFAPPELDYEGIRADFLRLFDDPAAGFEALKARLTGIDRETIIRIIQTNRHISHDDADRLLGTVEKARDDVLTRAERIRDETNRRLTLAREQAMAQLDQSRKVVSAAAWWLFAILLVSGIAALLGGMLGATSAA